jgi:hypothetical protein
MKFQAPNSKSQIKSKSQKTIIETNKEERKLIPLNYAS